MTHRTVQFTPSTTVTQKAQSNAPSFIFPQHQIGDYTPVPPQPYQSVRLSQSGNQVDFSPSPKPYLKINQPSQRQQFTIEKLSALHSTQPPPPIIYPKVTLPTFFEAKPKHSAQPPQNIDSIPLKPPSVEFSALAQEKRPVHDTTSPPAITTSVTKPVKPPSNSPITLTVNPATPPTPLPIPSSRHVSCLRWRMANSSSPHNRPRNPAIPTGPFGLSSALPQSPLIAPSSPLLHPTSAAKLITPFYTDQPVIDSSVIQPPHVLHAFASNPTFIHPDSTYSLSDHSLFYIFYCVTPHTPTTFPHLLTGADQHTAQRLVFSAFTTLIQRDWVFIRLMKTEDDLSTDEKEDKLEGLSKKEKKKERRRLEKRAEERGKLGPFLPLLEQYGLFFRMTSPSISKKKKGKTKSAQMESTRVRMFDVNEWNERDLDEEEEEEYRRIERTATHLADIQSSDPTSIIVTSESLSQLSPNTNDVPSPQFLTPRPLGLDGDPTSVPPLSSSSLSSLYSSLTQTEDTDSAASLLNSIPVPSSFVFFSSNATQFLSPSHYQPS
ncbi:hypothetical protein BLNAU_9002 [Blattamonas nauphoetae]|uniref:PX domain-containing protein n=1 Tax=Blattamonas nauphoetae TaxID=2049346 RepID=A0ABQ9XX13_9EUKA|nr:hypothetical protein BLNAU_9002 [Blattamonas nauphoetae]